MNDISLQTALKLIRYNTDSEVGSILQSALDELDRLTRVEKQAINLAKAAIDGAIDRDAAWNVITLTKTEIAIPVDAAEWTVMNEVARRGHRAVTK